MELLKCRFLKVLWGFLKATLLVFTFIVQAYFISVVSPNEVIFVKKEVRQGVLPRMLQEILDTRVMIKTAMKTVKGNKVLKRIQTNKSHYEGF